MLSKAKRTLLLSNWALGVLMALVVYLVAGPMLLLILSAFKRGGIFANPGWTLTNYVKVYSDPGVLGLLGNTLAFAAGATLVTLVVSIPLAWLIERGNIPIKNWLRITIIAPMGIPIMLSAMGWVLLASPKIGIFNTFLMDTFNLSQAPFNLYSLPGMIFVQAISGVPSSFLLLSYPFRNMDPAFEDASMVSGVGMLSTLCRIILPLLRPGILGVAILQFMYGLASFDVPGIIGMPARISVFSLKVYLNVLQVDGVPEFGQVSALASLYFAVVLVLTYVYNRQTKLAASFATITGRDFQPRITDLRRWKYVATAFILGYILLGVVFPLCILIWQSLIPYFTSFSVDKLHLVSLENWRTILQYPGMTLAIKNTLIVAGTSATVLVLLATIVSWAIVRRGGYIARLLGLFSMLPMALPHIMLGIALIFVYINLKIGIYGSIWIIVIAFVTCYLTYATRLLNSTMFQISKELEEVAQVSGANPIRVFRTIIMALLAPSMIGLWVWVAVHATRELSAALMLRSVHNFVVTTLMWDMWDRGHISAVATIGIFLVAAVFSTMGVGHLIAGRFAIVTGKR